MKVTVYGAGAIGGHLGAHLKRHGCDVSLIARGAHLEAMRTNGLKQITKDGEFITHPHVTDDPATLGPQDYVGPQAGTTHGAQRSKLKLS